VEITELPIEDILTEKPFSHFFPINDDTVRAIRIDMATNGYDRGFPLILWKDKNILVDGHTRFLAAKGIALDRVPVLYKHFDSEDDAVLYAFHLQRNRRNLSDDDIIRCLEILDKISSSKKEKAGNKDKPAKKESAELRAKELGTSKSKIEKARTILDHGNDDIKESVHSGKTSINKAFNDVQAQRRESGELKGATTTGLASDARYYKTYKKLVDEIRFLKDDNWIQVSQKKILSDLEHLMNEVERA
jgi:ParB family chromosome partitioning protein